MGCLRAEPPSLVRVWPTMGTFLRVEVVGLSEVEALRAVQEAHAVVDRWDRLMSLYKTDSEISVLNREGFNRCVSVSAETREMIGLALKIAKETEGAFDPTAGSSPKGIHRGHESVESGENCFRFRRRGIRIDLGGIAKGGALEKALIPLRKSGARAALVDLGGNAGVFGGRRSGERWKFNVALPPPSEAQLPPIQLLEGYISTSNQSERPGHILNPETGKSVRNDLLSVTVLSMDGARGDAASTALFVMGARRAKEYLKDHTEIGGCLVRTSGPSASREEDRLFCRPYEARNVNGALSSSPSSRLNPKDLPVLFWPPL